MRNKKSSGKAIFISTAVVLAVSAGCIFALHTVAARHTDNAGKSASIMTQEGKDIAAAGLLSKLAKEDVRYIPSDVTADIYENTSDWSVVIDQQAAEPVIAEDVPEQESVLEIPDMVVVDNTVDSQNAVEASEPVQSEEKGPVSVQADEPEAPAQEEVQVIKVADSTVSLEEAAVPEADPVIEIQEVLEIEEIREDTAPDEAEEYIEAETEAEPEPETLPEIRLIEDDDIRTAEVEEPEIIVPEEDSIPEPEKVEVTEEAEEEPAEVEEPEQEALPEIVIPESEAENDIEAPAEETDEESDVIADDEEAVEDQKEELPAIDIVGAEKKDKREGRNARSDAEVSDAEEDAGREADADEAFEDEDFEDYEEEDDDEDGVPSYYDPNIGSNPSLGLAIVDRAASLVGVTPYVWAGNSLEEGTDCSGFVSLIYEEFGLYAPRGSDAYQGMANITYDQLIPGDVVVYRYGGHVAIYAGGDTIIHCSNEIDGTKYSDMFYDSPTAYVRIAF